MLAGIVKFTLSTNPTLRQADKEKLFGYTDDISELFVKYAPRKSGRTQVESIQGLMDAASVYMTTAQKDHVNDIFDAINQLETNVSALDLRLSEIEVSALNLPEGEQAIILASTSVARNSAYYWAANIGEWQQYIDSYGNIIPGYYPERTHGQISWGGVAKMDVGGAVAWGLVTGAFAAVAGPIGWGFWIATTLTAGTLCSGFTALYFLVSRTTSQTQNTHTFLNDDLISIHIPD